MGAFLLRVLKIVGLSVLIALQFELLIYVNRTKSATNGGSSINWTVKNSVNHIAFWGDSRVWAGVNPLDSLSSINLAMAGVGYNILESKLNTLFGKWQQV